MSTCGYIAERDIYDASTLGDTTTQYYDAGTCWGDWNIRYKVTTNTNTNEANNVWIYWTAPNGATGGTQATASTSDWDTATIWEAWTPVGSYRVATPKPIDYKEIVLGQYPTPVQTPEQIAAAAEAMAKAAAEAEARRKEFERKEAERKQREQEAKVRAEDLLLSILNRRQRIEWKLKHQISIYEKGWRHAKFVLKNQPSSNVCEYNKEGKRIIEHCVVTQGVPLCDQLATQVLYLKNCPEELLKVANHFDVSRR